MKILQVAPYFPPYPGGQERHVLNLAIEQASRGHEVTVLTSDFPRGSLVPPAPGVRVIRERVRARLLRNPVVPNLLRRDDLAQSTDVIHVHNEHSFAANAVARWKMKIQTPAVLTCHGQLGFNQRAADAVERFYSRTLGAWTLKKMDAVIALSPTDARYLEGLGVERERLHVIPNAIKFPRLPLDADVAAFRQKFDLLNKEVVLFVGPLLARKAPEKLLAALPSILRARPNAVALFIGGGERLEMLQRTAASVGVGGRCRFTGQVSEPELYAAYRCADVLAVTSLSEGLPTTMLEALHLGVPCVASDLPAIADWFSGYCYIRNPDSTEFADAVIELLSDSSRCREMGKRGREYVDSTFSWETITERVLDLYGAIGAPLDREAYRVRTS